MESLSGNLNRSNILSNQENADKLAQLKSSIGVGKGAFVGTPRPALKQVNTIERLTELTAVKPAQKPAASQQLAVESKVAASVQQSSTQARAWGEPEYMHVTHSDDEDDTEESAIPWKDRVGHFLLQLLQNRYLCGSAPNSDDEDGPTRRPLLRATPPVSPALSESDGCMEARRPVTADDLATLTDSDSSEAE